MTVLRLLRSCTHGASVLAGCLLAGAVLAPGCRTTTQEVPVGLHDLSATRARVTQSWEVRAGPELLGHVVRYASDDDPPRIFFLVRNCEHQDLGLIDTYGRAWRYRAHEREPEWITTGTVLQGARTILEAGPLAILVEEELAQRPPPGS